MVNNTGLTATASLTYSCSNTGSGTVKVTACLSIGDPHGVFYSNRWIDKGSERLYVQMYQDAANAQIWGTVFNAAVTPPKITLSIPARSTVGPTTLTVYGTVQSSQVVSSGTYTTSYGSGDTAFTFSTGSDVTCQGNSGGGFPFNITATLPKSCIVTAGAASDIQLGAASGVNFTDTNLMGSNTISVTCSSGIAYYIGLRPSNNNTGGAGVMAAQNTAPVTGNTDSVPYQLRSSPGMTGTIWGNTATSTSVGNGKSGSGTGMAQAITVYATTPGANFTPDSYADTVTVTVNY